MPQVDLETLVKVCAGGGNGRKIACEPSADGGADKDRQKNIQISHEHDASDFPPESFWLSKDAEYDWFDRNAFYERKESTKGGNSNSAAAIPHLNHSASSTSQRFSVNVKPKAFIIGLPNAQKTTFVDSKRRMCKATNIRLFPQKRPESVGKSTVSVTDPGSPKVSCMGRVRSKRCRRRSNSLKRKEKPAEKSRTGDENKKTGFYSKLMNIFRSKEGKKKPSRSGSRKVVEEPVVVEPQRKSVSVVKPREILISDEPVSEPPSLGGMKRFSSGRRSGSWTAEDFNQVVAGELDRRVGPMGRS